MFRLGNTSKQLLTSMFDPSQDEKDEDGDEDDGDTCTNHHPHHLEERTDEDIRATNVYSLFVSLNKYQKNLWMKAFLK